MGLVQLCRADGTLSESFEPPAARPRHQAPAGQNVGRGAAENAAGLGNAGPAAPNDGPHPANNGPGPANNEPGPANPAPGAAQTAPGSAHNAPGPVNAARGSSDAGPKALTRRKTYRVI
ncbi:hypothetical protein N7497_005175 [Penicillium chrysogenum]|nr:hypothetical protein N7497_005175 [Penicillium chrysogenum]